MNDVSLIIGDLGNGGTQRVIAALANHWIERGRKVCVITQSSPDSDFHELDSRVQRLCFGSLTNSNSLFGGLFNNIGRVISLRRSMRLANARVTIAAVSPTAVLAVLAGMGLPTRIVVAERNDPTRQSYGRYWDFLRRILYPRAALVTANSQGALDSLSTFVPAERLAHLPNPLAPDSGSDIDGPRQPTILNVGRLQRQKGQDVLIEAFAAIADECKEWRLAIAGAGRLEEQLKSLASRLGIAARIDWLGEVDDVYSLYRKASIFALPSRHEGMPNALLEAMSTGLPAIVTNASPGPLEMIEDGICGLTVPVDDVTALADALRLLIADAALRDRMGATARERTRAFDLETVSTNWEKVIGMPPLVQSPLI